MPIPTYQEMLEKIKSRQMPSTGSDSFGLSKNDISTLGKKDLESFVSELVKHLEKLYGKDKEFKSTVDADIEKGTKETYKSLNTFLKAISGKVYNEETKKALSSSPANIADRLIKGLEKTFEKVAPVTEAPVKDLKPLSKEELKLFSFDEGVIESGTTKDRYHEAIKDFVKSSAASKMTEAEKSSYINRFKKMFNAATGSKDEDEVLDVSELENFKLGEKKLESLSEIKPDINQGTAFGIVQSLNKKRLHPDVKKDLIVKFFNTVRSKKIKELGSLSKFEEKWLDKKDIERMAENAARPKTRIEYLEGQPAMTQEERREFRRDDKLKQRIKVEDTGRVLEITHGALNIIDRLVDSMRETNWKKELDDLTKKLKVVVPPVGEMQHYIEGIEEILRDLNVSAGDFQALLHISEGQYKPSIDNAALKGILDKIREATKALETAREEKSAEKIKSITKNLKELESDKNRVLKLRSMGLKGLKSNIDTYLDYLKSKKEELSSYKADTEEMRGKIGAIEEYIKELRNYFRDLMREEEFMVRWSRPSSVTEEEKKKTDLAGADFPKEKKDEEEKAIGATKTAMDTDKYQKLYSKYMDSLDVSKVVGDIKDSVDSIVKTLALKMLSIAEFNPHKVEELESLKEDIKGTKGEQKKRLKSRIDVIKPLADKLGIKKDFRDNPYGGKGPSMKEMEDKLNELVKDLEKIDLSKRLEKIEELLSNLENLSKLVKLSKVDEEDMLFTASSLRKAAALILKKAEEKRVAPSNVGAMYDIAFGRKKPTPSGITRRLPNFFVQDTSGLAKKVVEYLEKTGVQHLIDNPKADVSSYVEEVVNKTLKIPGKVEDYLANQAKRSFETKLDLKKAREDLKRVRSLLEGKKDEKGNVIEEGLQKQLDTFRQKNIGQVEEALKFVLDPLDRLWESVVAEHDNIPKAEEMESKKSEALTTLLGRISEGSRSKDVLGDIKKFVDENIDYFIAGKEKLSPKEKLIKDYNETFSLTGKNSRTEIPNDSDIDKDIYDEVIKDKNKISELVRTLEKFPEENAALVKKFEAEHNLDLDKINRNKNTNEEWQKYMAAVMREFNAFIETMGGVRKVDILQDYANILGKKHNDFPPANVVETDIESFKKSKKDKLKKMRADFIKRRERVADPKAEGNFLASYNKKFDKSYKQMPSSEDIKKDFKEYIVKEQGDVQGDKELIEKFNKITGLSLTRVPTKKDIEEQFKRNTGRALNYSDIVGSKELALKALMRMPEDVEERVQKGKTDITGERWYKALLRDKSHHKTRWIDRLLKDGDKSLVSVHGLENGLRKVRENAITSLNKKNEEVENALRSSPKTITSELNNQLANAKNLIQNKNPKAALSPLGKFKDSVIKPIQDLYNARMTLSTLENVKELLTYQSKDLKRYIDNIEAGYKMSDKEFYGGKYVGDGDIKQLPQKEQQKKVRPWRGPEEWMGQRYTPEQIKSMAKKNLSNTEALIKKYETEVQEAKNTVDAIIASIQPSIDTFIDTVSALFKREGIAIDPALRLENSKKVVGDATDPKIQELVNTLLDALSVKGDPKVRHDTHKNIGGYIVNLMATVSELINLKSEYQAMQKEKGPEVKKEAADDPYGEKLSPYEVALEKTPGREDLISKDKPEFYKKIQKTINYFKKIVPEIEARSIAKSKGKDEIGAGEYIDYFNGLSQEIPNYTAALKAEIIPGLRGLLKQKVKIPGILNITTSLEDAVQTLEDVLESYTNARTKLVNRLETEKDRHKISLDKVKEISEYMDPETGEFIDFNDKEKDILKRVFMRQVYKYLDELWAQKQAQVHPVMGERTTEYYNTIWQSFKEYSGVKTNRKLIGILNALKAETKADSFDDVKRIYLKSQQLEDRKKELEKKLRELGLDPERNEDIIELDKLIKEVAKKEEVIDRIFNEMLKGSELKYISKIREGLREKALVTEKDPEIDEFAPTAPAVKSKKKDEEKNKIKEVAEDVSVMIDKVDEGLRAKGVSNIEAKMDELVEKSYASIKNIEDILKQGTWEIKSATYRDSGNFNPNILYGSLMQSTIRNLLKSELSR